MQHEQTLRIGLVGGGQNTRVRHIPGLRAISGVELVAVCNRRPESTRRAAEEFQIPKTFSAWEQLVADKDIDAVVIGTWPYLHCPITMASLESGKHVLCEARMAMNAAEAHRMLDAAHRHLELVTQIVPSPFGLKGDRTMKRLIGGGFLGELREVHVHGMSDALADPEAPLGWRQVAEFSGVNTLSLGILHETVTRWIPQPVHVFAQTKAFIPERIESELGQRRAVGTPDSVQVLTRLDGGGHALYQLSGVTRFSPGNGIVLYGSRGTLRYELNTDRIYGAQAGDDLLREIPIPDSEAGGWRVELDFVEAIRSQRKIELTDFATGVRYMEFTEAVAQSAETGRAVHLPLRQI